MSSTNQRRKSSIEDDIDVDPRILSICDTKTSEQEEIPSKVKDKDHIHYPLEFEKEKRPESGGKWMLFANGDMDKLDYRWKILKSLYHEGIITGIKSSTLKKLGTGATICYTSDCEDKETVKEAADKIRNLIEYEYVMYYKTNEASAFGKYRENYSKSINMYMHTLKGQLYKRDELKRWKYLTT